MKLPIAFTWLSQAALILGIIICVSITKVYVSGSKKGGVSNYGTDGKTNIPFSLAFFLEGLFMICLIVSLPTSFISSLRLLLYIETSLIFLTLASTYNYKKTQALKIIHIIIAALLLGYQSVFSIYLVTRLAKGPIIIGALVVELIGVSLCIGSLAKIFRNLFAGQVLAALGFAALLITAVPKVHTG